MAGQVRYVMMYTFLTIAALIAYAFWVSHVYNGNLAMVAINVSGGALMAMAVWQALQVAALWRAVQQRAAAAKK